MLKNRLTEIRSNSVIAISAIFFGLFLPISFTAPVANADTAGSGNCVQTFTNSAGSNSVNVHADGGFCYIAFRNLGSAGSTSSSYSWTKPLGITSLSVLVIGGGGGGGARHGGGGGAGSYVEVSDLAAPHAATSINVVVGSGGAGAPGGNGSYLGSKGSNSSFRIGTSNGLVALGGGGGINGTSNVVNGGSGGGAGANQTAGIAGTSTQLPLEGGSALSNVEFVFPGARGASDPNTGTSNGKDFWAAGGGGGAGARGQRPSVNNSEISENTNFSDGTGAGTRGGNGGVGKTPTFLNSTIATQLSVGHVTGGNVFFAGGGGGGMGADGDAGGTGGNGGGGDGTKAAASGGISGMASTGGGGGGSGFDDVSPVLGDVQNPPGGAGGSGVVIVRYSVSFLDLNAKTDGTNTDNWVDATTGNNISTPNTTGNTFPTWNSTNKFFSFNGSNHIYKNVSYSNPNTISLEIWFRTTSTGAKIIGFQNAAGNGSSTNNYDRHLYVDTDGKLRFGLYNGNGFNYVISSGAVNDGKWHHAVATYASGTARLYIDGTAQTPTTGINTATQNYSGYWVVGGGRLSSWAGLTNSGSSAAGWTGDLAVARVYSIELNSSQVSSLRSQAANSQTVTLSFDANTGSGTMTAQQITYGTATAINSNSLTKSESNFSGWSTTSGGSVEYSDGAQITLQTDATVYAKWIAHLMVYEPFTGSADTSLVGQAGSGSTGLTGNWQLVKSNKLGAVAQSSVYRSYPNLALPANTGFTLPTSNTVANGTNWNLYYSARALSTPISFDSAGTYYFSYISHTPLQTYHGSSMTGLLEELPTTTSDDGPWSLLFGATYPGKFGIDFGDANKATWLSGQTRVPSGADYSASGTKSSNTTTESTAFFVLVKIVTATTGNDQIYLRAYSPSEFLPSSDSAINWDVNFETPITGTGRYLAVETEYYGAVDEVRIGSTYNSVTNYLAISSDATLSNLTISNGTLSSNFASATTSYTASVANSVTSMSVTPTKTQANATIQVKVNSGSYSSVTSGSASSSLSLNVGSNTIYVLVTAQDGTTQTYTITVTRAAVAVTPVISSQPEGATKTYGQSITFSVTASASDSGSLTYQWQKNGTNISGATANTYTIASVVNGDAADYRVVVTNSINDTTASTNSSTATLIVNCAPSSSLVSSGLILHLDAGNPCSTGTSGVWRDISGNSNSRNLTWVNTPTLENSNGGFYEFVRNSSHYGTLTSDGLSDFTNGFTLSFYARFDATGGGGWERIIDFGKGNDDENIVVAREGSTSRLILEFRRGSVESLECSADIIQDGVWAHYAVTVSPVGGCVIYKNGNSQSLSVNRPSDPFLPNNTTRNSNFVGESNWTADTFFDGGIGDLALYSRALSAAEISTNFSAQSESYEITYEYNSADGGNGTSSATFTVGGTGLTLPTPTRTGYTFGGWYEASNLSGSALTSPYSPSQSRTIYAKWTQTFVVTYEYNSADGGNTTTSSTFLVGGSAITLPVPTKTGSTFGGWYVSEQFEGSAIGSTYTPSQSITIYAKWTEVTVAPSAPRDIQVSRANQSLILTWQAPQRLSGTTITGYRVEYSTTGTSNWIIASSSISSSTLTYTISGLTTGTSYYTRVAALFSGGRGAYGYPWTEIYKTVKQNRKPDGTIEYEPNLGLIGGAASANTSTSFTRVRYRMGATYDNQSNYVDADFNRELGTKSTSSTTFDSISKLQIPIVTSGSSRFIIHADVTDLAVESNVSAVVNGFDLSGRLEIWPMNYGVAPESGFASRVPNSYDDSDTPVADGSYGSFQLHKTGTGTQQTIFAWNRHYETTASAAEVGFGNAPSGNSDWTFCSNVTCAGRSNFSLQIFINAPTVVITQVSAATPVISDQPSSISKTSGQSASFSVSASVSDGGTLSYQWQKNGSNISGATTSTYSINSTATSDSGDYQVVITNTLNGNTATTTSSVATLTVSSALTITTPSTGLSAIIGSPFSLSISSSGGSGGNTFAVASGTLPTGLALSGNSISGTPTNAGTSAITIRVTDTNTATATTSSFTITVRAACTPTSTTSGGFTILTFTATTSCFWAAPSGVTATELIVVAGGGGGGDSNSSASRTGGSGGAGGFFSSNNVGINGVIGVTVGAGGAGATADNNLGTNGGDSAFGTLKVGGGGGGSSVSNTTLTLNSGNGGSDYVAPGNGGGGRSHQNLSSTVGRTGGTAGSYANSGITFLGQTYTGIAGVNGGSGGGDFGSGGLGGQIAEASRTSSITGTSTVYSKRGPFLPWTDARTGTFTYGSGGSTNYLYGATENPTMRGGAGAQGVIVLKFATPISYSYDLNGGTGSVPTGGVATVGSNFTTADSAGISRTNYTFTGWNTAANGSGTAFAANTSVTMPTIASPIVLYAQWTISNVTVTFNANSGTGSMSDQVFAVATATQLSSNTFTRTGYTFTGWNTAANGSGTNYSDGESVTLNQSITLYAKWTPNQYVITYNYNSATGGNSASTNTYTVDGTAITLPAPIRAGYAFDGWYEASNFSGSSLTSPYAPTQTRTIYAKWTANTVTVTFYRNDGVETSTVQTLSADSPTNLTANSFVRTGYTFAGWNTLADGTGTNYSNNQSVTLFTSLVLYAKWTANTLTITFNKNDGGSTSSTQSVTAGSVANLTSNSFTRAGYLFSGWNTAADGSGTSYGDGVVLTRFENLGLFAKWTAVSYTVTYNINNSTGTVPTESNKNIGNTFSVASDSGLSRTGYSFGGWSDGTNTFQSGASYTMPAANVTLIAQWNINTYVVTYNANNGSGNLARNSDSYQYGSAAIVLPGQGGLLRAGYSFSGWATSNSGTAIVGGYTPTQSTTLYAVWSPNTYTITYNANGASGTPSVSTETYTVGNAGTNLATVGSMTRTGQSFNGWSLTANGSAVSAPFTTTEAVTLYAIWTPIGYTITYNLNGGDSVLPTESNKYYNETFTLASAATKPISDSTSWAFVGWSDSVNQYQPGVSYRMPDRNVTLTAIWIAVYTVKYTMNGASTAAPADSQQSNNSVITLAPAPTRTGYNFTNWKDQSNNLYNANETMTVTAGSYLLYAQWSPINYSLTYNANGGSNAPSNSTFTIGSEVTVGSAPTWLGYTFNGWSYGGQLYGPGAKIIAGSENINLSASWTAINYTVSYDMNGSANNRPNGLILNIGQTFQTASAPTRVGYTFAGWSNSSTLTPASTTYTMGAGDVTLVASWNAVNYSLSYDVNGGSSQAPSGANNLNIGGTFTVATAPSHQNRSFLGWSDGTNTYTPGQSYTVGSSNITLTAVWSGVNYTITYDLNGGSGIVPTEVAKQANDTFVTKNSNGFSRAHHNFVGWKIGNQIFAISETITVGSAPITLIAQWTPSFDITFDTNGGSSVATTTFTGTALPQPTNPSKQDFVFNGWTNNGTTVTWPLTPTGPTSLTAQWIQASLYGLDPADLTRFGSLVATTGVAGSFRGSNSNSSILVEVPADSLPNGTVINIDLVGDLTRARELISNTNNYLISFVVSWLAPNGTVPKTATNKPIEMTISQPDIRAGAAIYSVVGETVTVLGRALQDGFVTIEITEDPEILVAKTVPGVPTNVAATSNGNQQAVISWTPPTYNGGAIIDTYTATANNGQSCSTSGLTCTIQNLNNGTLYTFTVTATNVIGTSDPSSAVSANTVTVYTVTFNSKGGSAVSPTTFLANGTVAEPQAPTRAGFVFGGWSATDGGEAVTFPYPPAVNSDITLYARWSQVPSQNGGGGSNNGNGSSNSGNNSESNSTPVESPNTGTKASDVVPPTSPVINIRPIVVVGADQVRVPSIDLTIRDRVTTPFGVTNVTTIKVAAPDESFVQEISIVDNQLQIVPAQGFSGKRVITIYVTEDLQLKTIVIPLTVLPEPVGTPIVTPASVKRSAITWQASPNAINYEVLVNGKVVCKTAKTECAIRTIIGPKSEVGVIANGGDKTLSDLMQVELNFTEPIQILRLAGSTRVKPTLSTSDKKALDTAIALIKDQGFTNVFITDVSATGNMRAASQKRLIAIQDYIEKSQSKSKLSFVFRKPIKKTFINTILVAP